MSEDFEHEPRRPWWPVAAALGVVIAGIGLVALGHGEGGTGDDSSLPVEADEQDGAASGEHEAEDGDVEAGTDPADDPDRLDEGPPEGEGPPDAGASSQPTPGEVDALPGAPDLLLYALTDGNSIVEFDLGTGERRESQGVHLHPNGEPSRVSVTDELVLLHDSSRGHLYGRTRDFEGGLFRLDEPQQGQVRTVLPSPDGSSAWAVIGEPRPQPEGEQEVRPVEAERLGEPVANVASPFNVFAAVEGGFVLSGPGGAAHLSDDGDSQDWPGLSTVDHSRGVVLLRRCSPGQGCQLWRSRGPTPERVDLDEEQSGVLATRGALDAAVSPDGSRAALHDLGMERTAALPIPILDLDDGETLASIELPEGAAPRGLQWSPDGSWLFAVDPVRRGSVLAWAPDDGRHVSLQVTDSYLRHVEILDR